MEPVIDHIHITVSDFFKDTEGIEYEIVNFNRKDCFI